MFVNSTPIFIWNFVGIVYQLTKDIVDDIETAYIFCKMIWLIGYMDYVQSLGRPRVDLIRNLREFYIPSYKNVHCLDFIDDTHNYFDVCLFLKSSPQCILSPLFIRAGISVTGIMHDFKNKAVPILLLSILKNLLFLGEDRQTGVLLFKIVRSKNLFPC